MLEGWIKLYRISIEKGWLSNHKLWAFWSYCLLKATHKKHVEQVGFQRVELEPGQFVFGLHVASEQTGLTIQNIRTCLDSLKRSENLTIKSTNKFSVITIVNWGNYQGEENKSTSKVTNNQQTTNKQLTTNKKVKNINNDKKVNTYSDEFERFWSEYPPHRRTRKKECYVVWKSGNLDKKIEEILTGLENHKASYTWTKEDGDRVRGAKGWLEDGNWGVVLKPLQQQSQIKSGIQQTR